MYPVPFDRKQILAKEINNLVGELTSIDVWNELRVSRKKNDNRLIPIDGITSGKEDSFPGIEAMQDYICNAVTTDVMLERINQTLREVKAYFHQEHAQDFIVSYENLVSQLELRDETLREALRVLGIVYQPSATRFPSSLSS